MKKMFRIKHFQNLESNIRHSRSTVDNVNPGCSWTGLCPNVEYANGHGSWAFFSVWYAFISENRKLLDR